MKSYNDEETHQNVIKILKGMPHIEAPENFENDLMRKINSGKFENDRKKTPLLHWLIPSRLIPSAAVLASAVVVFLLINSDSSEASDPFLIEPKLREDIYEIPADLDAFDVFSPEEPMEDNKNGIESSPLRKKSYDSEQPDRRTESVQKQNKSDQLSDEKPSTLTYTDSLSAASESASELTAPILSRKGLSYKVINMNEQEQNELNQLKEKMKKIANSEDIQ